MMDGECGQMAKQVGNGAGRIQMTMTDRLKQRRKEAQQTVDSLDAAIKAVEASPGVQAALDAISRVNVSL